MRASLDKRLQALNPKEMHMTLKKPLAVIAAAVLAGSLLSAPAVAQSNTGFAALQGVEAQALSADEMQAVQGLMSLTNLNQLILAIKADSRLTDTQERYAVALWNYLYQLQLKDPRWQPYVDKLFEWTRLNVYPNAGMCAVNADFCTGPFPGTP